MLLVILVLFCYSDLKTFTNEAISVNNMIIALSHNANSRNLVSLCLIIVNLTIIEIFFLYLTGDLIFLNMFLFS